MSSNSTCPNFLSMLYHPSPEKLPRLEKEPIDTARPASAEQLRRGYSYACIGAALTILEQTSQLAEDGHAVDSIISEHGDVSMWSAHVLSGDVRASEHQMSFIYEPYFDETYSKDTLVSLWVAKPRLLRRGQGYLFTRDSEERPQAHYFSVDKGWSVPSARQLKKLLHRQFVPIKNGRNDIGRLDMMRNEDLELYRHAMEQFSEFDRGEN